MAEGRIYWVEKRLDTEKQLVDPYYFCQSAVVVYFDDQKSFKIPK